MCQTLKVPCHAIPNHPCCKELSTDFEEDKKENNFKFTQDQDKPQHIQRAIETTEAPKNVESEVSDEEFVDQEMCFKVSCQSQPNHHCCSEELPSKEDEEDDYQEESFDFSRVAPMTYQVSISSTFYGTSVL